MSMPVGYRSGNKLYQRCHVCGDTNKDPNRGHLILYLDSGAIHCSRCGHHDFATISDMMGIWDIHSPRDHQKKEVNNDPTGDIIPPGSVGPSGRISYVEKRWVAQAAEIFSMRTPGGKTRGYHMRSTLEKKSNTRGVRSFGYYGPRLPTLAEGDGFLRIVEGPYDVIYPVDLCTFGIPDKAQINSLAWRNLVICPDGDVWGNTDLLRSWISPFIRSGLMIQGVEHIPNNGDPDECPANQRMLIPWEEFKEWYRRQR